MHAKTMESDKIEKPVIEPEAEEVLEGVGFYKVKLGYHMMFSNQKPVKEYEMAYVLNGKLILVNLHSEDGKGWNRKELDMRLLGELTVRVEQRLNCGLRMERDIKVIDCKEEKMQEFLELQG